MWSRFEVVYCRLIEQAENNLLHTRLAEEELKCRKLTIYSVRFEAFHFFCNQTIWNIWHIWQRLHKSTSVNSVNPAKSYTICPLQPNMNIFRSLVTAMHLYTKAGFREVSLYLFDTVLITSGSVFCLYGLTWLSSQRLERYKSIFLPLHVSNNIHQQN